MPAECSNAAGQGVLQAAHLGPAKPVTFPQFGRPVRAIEVEHGLAVCPDHMDMGGPMISRIDNDAQPVEAQHRGHRRVLSEIKALWNVVQGARRLQPATHAADRVRPYDPAATNRSSQ